MVRAIIFLLMKWLTEKSKELIAKLVGDFAKIILAGYFAGEFFVKLTSFHKLLFWIIFVLLIIVFLLLVLEGRDQK